MSRTVHEKRWKGNPSSELTKDNENQFLGVVDNTGHLNNDMAATMVTLTDTADLPIIGEYQTYTDNKRVLIESGYAVLQASAAYTAADNGKGVLSTTTKGVVAAVTRVSASAVTGVGRIVGGGTREVNNVTVNVYYVVDL